MENQSEFIAELRRLRERYREEKPGILEAQEAFMEKTYAEGAISTKNKRLMSLAIGIANGAAGCMIAQTMFALEAGATKDEVLEAIAVARSMGGTMAGAHSYRVLQYLEEKGVM